MSWPGRHPTVYGYVYLEIVTCLGHGATQSHTIAPNQIKNCEWTVNIAIRREPMYGDVFDYSITSLDYNIKLTCAIKRSRNVMKKVDT